MTPKLRRASIEDHALVLGFLADFYVESGFDLDRDRAASAIHRLIENEAYGHLYVIEVDAAPVGYTALTFGFSLEFDGRDGIIDDLYVAPTYRDQGIGSAVVELVLEAARQEGLNAVHLEVDHENERAKKVYFRAGFKDYKRHLLSCRLRNPLGHPNDK